MALAIALENCAMVSKCQMVDEIEATAENENASGPQGARIPAEDNLLIILGAHIDVILGWDEDTRAYIVLAAIVLDNRAGLVSLRFNINTAASADIRVAITFTIRLVYSNAIFSYAISTFACSVLLLLLPFTSGDSIVLRCSPFCYIEDKLLFLACFLRPLPGGSDCSCSA